MRRYYGFNKATAYTLGGTLALLKWHYLGIPTDDVSYEAIVAIERIATLAAVCYGFQFLSFTSAIFRTQRRVRQSVRIAKVFTLACLAIAVLGSTIDFIQKPDLTPKTLLYGGWSLSTVGLAWLPVAFLELQQWFRSQTWYRRLFLAGEGANSGMASPSELRRRRIRPRFLQGTFGFTSGLILGRTLPEATYEPFHLQLKGEMGTVLLGNARSGKSVRFLFPWIATNNQTKIVVDPKAHAMRLLTGRLSDPAYRQLFADAGIDASQITQARENLKKGRVFAFDPYRLGHPYLGEGINTVILVDPKSPYCRVMLSAISQSLVIPSGDENHWSVELSRLVLEGLVMHIRTSRPLSQQNLSYLADLFSGFEVSDEAAEAGMDQLIQEMRNNPAGDGICASAAQTFASLQGREVGIVISEIARSLKSFTDPVIRAATSGWRFDLREVVESQTPVTLFLSLPFGAMGEHSRVLRVIISCLLRLSEQRQNKSRVVNFFLDEFASYAKNLTAVRDATVTLGGARVRIIIAIQYIQQLSQSLGRDAADAFEASSHIVAAGVSDLNTCEYLSKRFGKHKQRQYRGFWPFQTLIRETETPVLDNTTLSRLLDRKSRIGACIPGSGAPFLFETLAYKSMSIEGGRLDAWELPFNAFDDHLLATERGEAPPNPSDAAVPPQQPLNPNEQPPTPAETLINLTLQAAPRRTVNQTTAAQTTQRQTIQPQTTERPTTTPATTEPELRLSPSGTTATPPTNQPTILRIHRPTNQE